MTGARRRLADLAAVPCRRFERPETIPLDKAPSGLKRALEKQAGKSVAPRHGSPPVAALAALLGIAVFASGFIHRMYSLEEIMKESTNIMVGKIESVDAKRKRIVARVERNLKGKSPYKRVQMNLSTGVGSHVPYLLANIKPGQSIIIFYKRERENIACLCYVDRFWFQLYAQDAPNRDRVWWRFTHVEIYMGRTWDGSQAELARVVADVLRGKRKPPRPNPKIKPLDIKREMARSRSRDKQTRTVAASGEAEKIFGRLVALPHGKGETRGVSWIDFDGDGDLDAYCCCSSGDRLYRYDGGTKFRDVTRSVGLGVGSRAGAWADYNGDGRLDLLLSVSSEPPRLYTNRGKRFSDDSKLLPRLRAYNTEGCGWIDYNGDGAPDILLTNGEHGIALFRNEWKKKRRFRDVSREVGLGPKGPGAQNGDFIAIADWDGDGLSDFLYNVGKGLLLRNNGQGRFELARKCGISFATSNDYKIGAAWGDYDRDGDLDLYVPQKNLGKLFRNNGDGSFTDVTRSAGDLARVIGDWTVAAWGDLNCDGWLDLYVGKANGDGRLFINQGNGRFENMVQEMGLYHLPGNRAVMGVALADFDRDGDLDILANSAEGRLTVFINDLRRHAKGPSYLVVRPAQTHGAVGAVVRLFDTRDRLLGLSELGTAQNMGSQAPLSALFGVPKGKYKVTICMSDGRFGQKIVKVGDKGLEIKIGVEGK